MKVNGLSATLRLAKAMLDQASGMDGWMDVWVDVWDSIAKVKGQGRDVGREIVVRKG